MTVRTASATTTACPNGQSVQRIDKWLWCARFFKTRTLAAKFVSGGQVRLTRRGRTLRIAKPAFAIEPGDQITFAIGARLVDLIVLNCAARRGPAPEAQSLFEDRSPPRAPHVGRSPQAAGGAPSRASGAGRPTKKERRALADFLLGADTGGER